MSSGITVADDGIPRCWWGAGDPLYRRYHDTEWGRPVSNDRRLFEKLCLEGFMSGLSWLTILRKRENFRAAFAQFDPDAVARFGSADQQRLLNDQGIVRNAAKIAATINNARRCRELQTEFGSFAAYVWGFEPPSRSRRLEHIDRELDQPLELETLARVANFSPFHFHRLFTAWMGETLGDYMRRRRLELAAQRLVAQPRLPVLQVALSVGFGSTEAFARAFKTRFGSTPTGWRDSQRRKRDQRKSNHDQRARSRRRMMET